jgi:hypothetical protein
MSREQVRGVMLIPEKFKLLNSTLTHVATRYKIYADRAKTILIIDQVFSGTKKDAFTYYDDTLYDDQILYFTTNMQLSDETWCGESPLTRVVLRREQVSSTGIIVTPNVSIYKLGLPGGFNIIASDFIRYEGTAAHDSTTYRIEDEITGEVAFEREDDRDNLLTIKVPDNILKPNRVYRISVRFKDVVGRYSNYGSMLYNYNNLLYTMFPIETLTAPFGSKIKIDNKAIDRVIPDDIVVEGYIDSELVYTGTMISNAIIIDTKRFSIGDVLEIKVIMNSDEKYITAYITKPSTVVKYDATFELSNVFENITMDLDTIIDTNGTTKQEFKDGYIYDYTMDNQLVRYKYDDVNKKLTNYTILRQYDMFISVTARRVVENPIDGNIIVLIINDSNSILILDINNYDIINNITINNSNSSAIYSQQPLIIDGILYIINFYNTITTNKTIHTLNLTTYTLELKGIISFDSLEANTSAVLYASGYNQLLYNGEIYFINNGGQGGSVNTVGKTVYKLNRTTLLLETAGILDIDIGIPSGAYSSILTTLKNGKAVLIYSKCSITANGSPVRTITGIYYIDLDTMTVDTTNMITGPTHTTTHINNVLLNDGTFLFFNDVECVHFK